MVDAAATQAALVRTGHDSFLRRVRRLVDPSPPTLLVDPVLVPRPGADELAERLSAALPKPRRAQVVSRRGEFSVIPSRPGDAIDPEQLLASLREGRAHRRAHALAGADARRARADDERRRGGGRRGRGARRRADRALLQGRGGRLARAAAPREARPLPPGRRPLPRHASRRTGSRRPSSRSSRTGGSARSTRASSSRGSRCGSVRRSRASHPTGRWISDSISAAAGSSIRRASLRLKQTRADLTTAEANRLGIREQISTFTTDMGTSSSNRIHNVQLMAEYIDGTIVAPGHEFSFNDRVGPRTVERGLPRGADDHRLAAAARRSAAASARRRRRSSTTPSSSASRSSSGTTTASTSRTIRSGATRPSPGAGPTSPSRTT